MSELTKRLHKALDLPASAPEGWTWGVTANDEETIYTVRCGKDGPAAAVFYRATCPDARATAEFIALDLNQAEARGALSEWRAAKVLVMTPANAAQFEKPDTDGLLNEAGAMSLEGMRKFTNREPDCESCHNSRTYWNELLQEYRPCIDCRGDR